MGIKIIKTSSYLPERLVENSFFEARLDTNDQWIRSRTGIERRRFLKDEGFLGMVEKVLENLKLSQEDLGKIKKVVVATCTYTATIPSLASQVQAILGLGEDIYAVDLNMACSGYVAGLSFLNDSLKEGEYGLLIGVEAFSPIMDFTDRSTCILFGDGAGSSLVRYTRKETRFSSGILGDLRSLNYGHKKDKLYMEGSQVYRFAVSKLGEEVENFLSINKIKKEEIDFFIFHQANQRILDKLAVRLGIDRNKIPSNIRDVGNISAASIPVLLDRLNKENKLKKGQDLVLVGFGAGLSWSIARIGW